MTRSGSILALAAAGFTLFAQSAAGAPVLVAPAGSGAHWGVRLAVGGDDRALLSWTEGTGRSQRAVVAERTATGRVLVPVDVLAGRPIFDPPFAFPSASGDDVLVHTPLADYTATDLLTLHRDRGAAAFGEPLLVQHARYFRVVKAAANARGDRAVLVRGTSGSTLLITARSGAGFGPPQPLGDVRPRGEPAVAIGPTGRIVVVYGSSAQAVVRRGLLGASLGAPHVLERLRDYPTFSVAIDDHGVATVAYTRFTRYRRGVRTTVFAVAARGVLGRVFGPVRVLERGTDGWETGLAAAGSTTAIAWGRGYPVGGLRVAVARGGGWFGPARSAGARPLHFGSRQSSAPNGAQVAVDAAGDILLAYQYGVASTHAALWIAGSRGFEQPAVVSSLGHGGAPAVALLPNRTPLVAFSDGDAVHLGDPGAGTRVALTPPRATMTHLDAAALQRDLRVTTRVVCRETCWLSAYGRITTGPGPNGKPRQVRSGRRFRGQVLRADEPIDLGFDAKPAARAALDASGHAKAVVTVTVSNASGVSRTISEEVEFGCRKVTPDCPRAPI